MVGDGVNDAAVLSAADVSFAMGSGTALAQTHADCVLLSGHLSGLCELTETAARTAAVVRQKSVVGCAVQRAGDTGGCLRLAEPLAIGHWNVGELRGGGAQRTAPAPTLFYASACDRSAGWGIFRYW